MPKKKTEDKNRKEEIDDEIVASLKSAISSQKKEEGGLEKDTEDFDVNLSDMDFSQFIHSMHSSDEIKAPVLERVALEAPRPIFVGQIPQGTQTDTGEENGKGIKYVASGAEKNEPKYTESGGQIYTESERLNFEDVGRKQDLFPQTDQKAFFTRVQDTRIEFNSPERVSWQEERVDFERVGRERERPEAKYEKYRPKLPK